MDTRYSPEQVELRSATAALLADLAPRTVADLDDEGRQGAPGQGRRSRRDGSSSAVPATTTTRWRRASTWRSWPGSWGGPRPTRRSSARWSPPISPGTRARSSATAAPRWCSTRRCVDLAVVPAGGSAEGVAVDCAGMTRGLLLAPDGDTTCRIVAVPIADAAPATDLTRALAR